MIFLLCYNNFMINNVIFMKKIKDRMMFLIDKINQANDEYYNLNKSTLTDQQFDALLKELLLLESKYPNYKFSFSPTAKVGGSISFKFQKILHENPMLSLNNVFNFSELRLFYNRIVKKFSNFTLITELKIDGLAISIKYKKGILEKAITRGNGFEGELITDNVRTIKKLPLKLKESIDLEVRGEIYMPNSIFRDLNNVRKKTNQSLFSNPRNAASGTLRQLNSKIVSERNLSIFLYSIVNPPQFIKTQKEVLEFLIKLGLPVNNYYFHLCDWNSLVTQIENYSTIKNTLDYNTDGVVIKINELPLQLLMGETSKAPKWAIAYKFKIFKVETSIINIFFQVGRTGVIIPVAELLPIIVDGSLISKVTLHNYDYIKKKDIRVNDFVLVHKSGDVIPEILETIKHKRQHQRVFQMITHCPCCNTLLIKKEINYFCPNIDCSEKNIQKLAHFVSKKSMNINTLGLKTLIFLFSKGFIKNFSDLYKLQQYKNQIIQLHGFGKKKFNNIIVELEKSKKKCFTNILIGLGINNVGLYLAKVLSKKFLNIDNLQNASINELLEIKTIGQQIAQNIKDFFLNPINLMEIKNLKKLGLSFVYIPKATNNSNHFFQNKRVIFTGALKKYSRVEAKIIAENLGAIITSSVSIKTDYIIVGENPGFKLSKAQKLNIPIINEHEWEKLI